MPASNLTYRRGEIRWVKLDPVVGAEAQKTRPCLIVQNDIINQYGLLTIVMPFRPGSKQAPYVKVCVSATTDIIKRYPWGNYPTFLDVLEQYLLQKYLLLNQHIIL
ncbi:MAG: type II toxin-antitoxin system PemK/MazF family toxin [Rhizonema sp. PD38]|nr:type II toxin-antitoxin system PemK/MazF family toxin [Rhizonema sp. PD38]